MFLEKMDKLEKDFKDRLKNALRQSKSSGKSIGTTISSSTVDTLKDHSNDIDDNKTTIGYDIDRDAGKEVELDTGEVIDADIIEIKIKKINDKWKLEIEKLENEKALVKFCTHNLKFYF